VKRWRLARKKPTLSKTPIASALSDCRIFRASFKSQSGSSSMEHRSTIASRVFGQHRRDAEGVVAASVITMMALSLRPDGTVRLAV
jgi:hypothetical protein